MHFRFLLILIFSFLSSQTFYESTIGVDFHSYNARALSIGSSSHILDRTALSLKNNPSNISIGEGFGL